MNTNIFDDHFGYMPPPNYNISVKEFYGRLKDHIEHATSKLNADEESQLIYYDKAGQSYAVLGIGYSEPDLLALNCIKQDGPIEDKYFVFLYLSTVELILVTTKKKKGEVKKAPLGFLDNLTSPK